VAQDQEYTMSHSKREQSEFNHAVPADGARNRLDLATSDSSAAAKATKMRVLESWEIGLRQSGDPYNGIGARVLAGRDLRR
jgi:hypothetical protein